MSDSLWPHGLQHTRLPCPSQPPGVCSNACLLSRWCRPIVSSSVTPFSSCLQFSPTSGSFPMSWLFTSGGQSIGASASALVLPMNIQSWFTLGLTGFRFDLFAVQGILKSLLQHHNSKASLFRLSVFLMVQPSIKNWCLRLAPRMLVKLLRTGSNSWRPQILLAGVHTVKKVCFHILICLKNIYLWCSFGASPVAQVVKNPPALQETWVRSRGWEDPLEKEVATHSSILAWRIP